MHVLLLQAAGKLVLLTIGHCSHKLKIVREDVIDDFSRVEIDGVIVFGIYQNRSNKKAYNPYRSKDICNYISRSAYRDCSYSLFC